MKTQYDAAAFAGQKVLLVDDVPQGTVARKSVLVSLGYEVETALDGRQALDLIAIHSFDVMVTDYKMPGMDGIELIRRAKQSNPSMKIVLLSGLADTYGFTEETSGADAVMAKSGTELSQLTRTIKKLLARKTLRKPVGSEVASEAKPHLLVVKSR
jgi:CheY-like chemotaxis protein